VRNVNPNLNPNHNHNPNDPNSAKSNPNVYQLCSHTENNLMTV